MGQIITKEEVVDISNFSEYQNVEYCVTRTSGDIDTQYIIVEPHISFPNYYDLSCVSPRHSDAHKWLGAHAKKDAENNWRVHLQTKDEDRHVCGMRNIMKFWPKSLDGKQSEIDKWRKEFIDKLEELEKERILKGIVGLNISTEV